MYFHFDKGIPIKSWYDDPHDQELKHTQSLLEKIRLNEGEDVRFLLVNKAIHRLSFQPPQPNSWQTE